MASWTGSPCLAETVGLEMPNGPSGGLNPLWVEWLMGFPPGWTDATLSGTPLSQKWHDPLALQSLNGGGPMLDPVGNLETKP
jgi:hypothetical protein